VDPIVFEPAAGVFLLGSGGARALISSGRATRCSPTATRSSTDGGARTTGGSPAARQVRSRRPVGWEPFALSEPLCATGNSGGSAELIYALTWADAGDVLTYALPTSGPFHRLDLARQGATDAAWPAQCAALLDEQCPDCAAQRCQVGGGIVALFDASFGATPRCSTPGNGGLAILSAASPVRGSSIPEIAIAVDLLIGELDDGPFAPLVIALHDELLTAGVDVSLSFIADAGHEMDQFDPGRDAILAALRAGYLTR
jgi:hypothetical protein